MKPSGRSNQADFAAIDWYGNRRGPQDRFVWLVLGNFTAAYDGTKLFIRIGCAKSADKPDCSLRAIRGT